MYFSKYIQVTVDGQCETDFVLTNWSLLPGDNKDVDLICLNKHSTSLV